MKTMKMHIKIFIAMALLVAGIMILLMFFQYRHQKDALINGVDKRLLSASQLYHRLLGTTYHDTITGKTSVSKKSFDKIVARNDSLCRELGFEYLWSLLEIEGRYYFTSATHKDKEQPCSPVAHFFQPHYKPELFRKAFTTMKPDYRYLISKWGRTRAIIFPYRDIQGRKYIVAASVTISDIDALTAATIHEGLLLLAAILFFSWLIIFLILIPLTRPLTKLTQSVEGMTGGDYDSEINVKGSREVNLLSGAFENLRVAVRDQLRLLQNKEENLRLTLDSIGDAVIVTDNQGYITRMNPVAENLTGWTKEESLKVDINQVLTLSSDINNERYFLPFREIIQSEKLFELPSGISLMSRTGKTRQIGDSAAPIRDREGNTTGVVIVIRDITEQIQMEEELRHAQRMEVVGQLAGGMAHDFNNMLNGIMGAADILNLKKDDTDSTKYINIILSASERAGDLTRKLLDFSRKGKILSTSVDVHEIIKDAVAILERSIDKIITIEVQLNSIYSMVVGDPVQLQNVFINLGVNARDAMPRGGKLKFTTSSSTTHENEIVIKVSDNGTGIPEELQVDIFNPFFTTKEQGQGTGLGLASVYGIIKGHNGEIQVSSIYREGTTFTIMLPVETTARQITTAPAETAPVKGSGTVLYIEDEEILRVTGNRMLEEIGYKVFTASQGREGLEIFEKEKNNINLVMIDIIMPVLNGLDTYRELRKSSSVPVIFVSGYPKALGLAEILKEDPYTGFIQKPFREQLLSEVVSQYIRK